MVTSKRLTCSSNAQQASTALWVRSCPSNVKLVCTARRCNCQNRLATAMKGIITVNLRRLTRQISKTLSST